MIMSNSRVQAPIMGCVMGNRHRLVVMQAVFRSGFSSPLLDHINPKKNQVHSTEVYIFGIWMDPTLLFCLLFTSFIICLKADYKTNKNKKINKDLQ